MIILQNTCLQVRDENALQLHCHNYVLLSQHLSNFSNCFGEDLHFALLSFNAFASIVTHECSTLFHDPAVTVCILLNSPLFGLLN